MKIIIGSAHIGENGKISGGKAGDQKQTSNPDYKGEVSLENFYVSSKGWIILRPKSIAKANKIAERMEAACNNKRIGYSQSDRYGVIKYGIDSQKDINCDCSSLVRECIKEAIGVDPGDFSTDCEADYIMRTGKFNKKTFVSLEKTPIYNGDTLVTKTKGHTVIVVSGNPRSKKETTENATPETASYYPKYVGNTQSIVAALDSLGEKDTSLEHRKLIGLANGIPGVGTAEANLNMLSLLKLGKLKKA